MRSPLFRAAAAGAVLWLAAGAGAAELPDFGGVYPHLAMFNNEGECGTGAVVPWAGRLWVITYGPHLPNGSSDRLYEIDDRLTQTVRPESVGGTHANRLIHRESEQLFIGPYVIGRDRSVRVIPPKVMPGRLTATARHLADPARKVYFATMEEGFYEVDVASLQVTELYPDANRLKDHAGTLLPGYHGKGAYTAQGRLVYANNGELSPQAQRRPDIPSGCLAEWDGHTWTVVRRNQFCEVTGPGGLHGNEHPDRDPLWSVGWDHRSLLLMCRDGGAWHAYRLPKASHTYDGAHGWNTEWPRIHDVGEDDLLMTMHGTFWRFPRTFASGRSAGIRPRSTYLKVVGDFCRWQDRLVFGCDDTAKNEFLNKRKAKGGLAGPGQSQSNLWFVPPARLDQLGPALGRGAVWLNDAVKAGTPSDPYLFAGYERRAAHLAHDRGEPVAVTFEVDAAGPGTWAPLRTVTVPASGYAWVEFPPADKGEWVRARLDKDCARATVLFTGSNPDRRPRTADPVFAGLAPAAATDYTGGLVRARGENKRTLQYAAVTVAGGRVTGEANYELGPDLKLQPFDDPTSLAWLKKNAAVPRAVLTADAASVLYTDDAGRRWRLPKGDPAFDQPGAVPLRVDREVCTERDLFNAHGIFYELPADNAGGFAKVRPIATHNRRLTDYCSYRGLLILAGVASGAMADNARLRHTQDGKAAVWVGAVDELWGLGKAVGRGGPWKDTAVQKDKPSDPYLLTGFDRKRLTLSHDADRPVTMRIEVDISGAGDWQVYRTVEVPAGRPWELEFSEAFQAYWLRVVAGADCRATAWLQYD